jgi:hypothetical protein
VFDGLDNIPWQNLHHAYGTAEDVPALLRALANPDLQEEALSELFGNIWHQGTVYEASSHAVPFLFELAAEPSITRREEILGLVAALADGKSYLAVHAKPGGKFGEFWRQEPDFGAKLATELDHVSRTRMRVFEHAHVTKQLLNAPITMVRVGAALVLSCFPEHVSEYGPRIREAANRESEPLARAAMFWCLGAIGDASPEACAMLTSAFRDYADPREAYAAALASYRIAGQPHPEAQPLFRQLAAAVWFAYDYLNGFPCDFTAGIELEKSLLPFEPDPEGATQALLTVLKQAGANSGVYPSIVHDLLELNFEGGKWRECAHLTSTQTEVLRCLVAPDAAWRGVNRLWFLIPKGAENRLNPSSSDMQKVRDDMRSILARECA